MDLSSIGISNFRTAYWNLTPEELVEHTIKNNQGVLADSGAIALKPVNLRVVRLLIASL